MCPIIRSGILHSEPTVVFVINEADSAEDIEEGEEGMCSVTRSETLHSELSEGFMVSEADRCPLTQS